MARKVVHYVVVTDDIDRESAADETVEFALDGWVYELDLTTAHAKELRELLAVHVEVAHDKWKMPPRKRRGRKQLEPLPQQLAALAVGSLERSPTSERTSLMLDRRARKTIREWGQEHGHPAPDVGKIPTETIRLYREENPDAYIPRTTLVEAGLVADV